VILAHRIELDPTAKQREYFERAAGTARFVWNWALNEWNTQYSMGGKPLTGEIKRYFNSIKYEKFPWLKDIHRDTHSQPFYNLQDAWSTFFTRLKGGGKARRPAFKKKGKCRDSFYLANDVFWVEGKEVKFPKVGLVRMAESLRFTGKIMSATVSREADRWFIAINVEMPDVTPPAPAGEAVGVDVGITTFATLSTGEKIEAPRPLRAAQKKLRRYNRWLSRKQLKSKNRRKAAMKLARHHRRVANIRKDFLHKLTTRLASQHSEICIEDLNVAGMSKNHALALHIMDAGWGEFRRQLAYKTPLFGSRLTFVDRYFPSSKTCSDCGEKVQSMPLSVREWCCPACGVVHDRDVNAAKNLSRAGYARIDACGDHGSGVPAMGRETVIGEAGTSLGY
jgi:putative transposase